MLFIQYPFATALRPLSFFFFFNDTATTEIYTLSLHDALPIYLAHRTQLRLLDLDHHLARAHQLGRSEEHTSELQSQFHLVCRLLLEKKKHQNHIDCNTPLVDDALLPTFPNTTYRFLLQHDDHC